MGLFSSKKSLKDSGLLLGATDNHCHLLYGVDDGVGTREETLRILSFLEECGFEMVWLTPHIMEDVPNTTAELRQRFDELRSAYSGPIRLDLAAEYMMDNLFEERLSSDDLLTHGGDLLLVETSTWSPPIDLWGTISRILSKGYRPLLAHPERYRYMDKNDYRRLHGMGVRFQLNLPSLLGAYGETALLKAEDLLEKGWYSMAGSDCHRERSILGQYRAPVLSKKTRKRLEPLMKGEVSD